MPRPSDLGVGYFSLIARVSSLSNLTLPENPTKSTQWGDEQARKGKIVLKSLTYGNDLKTDFHKQFNRSQ